ncbi:MAG: hypothetical protein JSU88_02070 [Nitrospinaceae bacterium]|nr:MAG: hypothetical protein JSU88_02070 [Nitrospinaceae bacterium]
MSGLKSAWELSLEKSDKLVPELKKQKKLSPEKKKEIAEVRTEFQARIADLDVTLGETLKKLPDRTPPENIAQQTEELKTRFQSEKKALEEELEKRIQSIRG